MTASPRSVFAHLHGTSTNTKRTQNEYSIGLCCIFLLQMLASIRLRGKTSTDCITDSSFNHHRTRLTILYPELKFHIPPEERPNQRNPEDIDENACIRNVLFVGNRTSMDGRTSSAVCLGPTTSYGAYAPSSRITTPPGIRGYISICAVKRRTRIDIQRCVQTELSSREDCIRCPVPCLTFS